MLSQIHGRTVFLDRLTNEYPVQVLNIFLSISGEISDKLTAQARTRPVTLAKNSNTCFEDDWKNKLDRKILNLF